MFWPENGAHTVLYLNYTSLLFNWVITRLKLTPLKPQRAWVLANTGILAARQINQFITVFSFASFVEIKISWQGDKSFVVREIIRVTFVWRNVYEYLSMHYASTIAPSAHRTNDKHFGTRSVRPKWLIRSHWLCINIHMKSSCEKRQQKEKMRKYLIIIPTIYEWKTAAAVPANCGRGIQVSEQSKIWEKNKIINNILIW